MNRLYIFIIILFFSCSQTKNLTLDEIVGEYKWTALASYDIIGSLVISSDYSFNYKWQVGLLSGNTTGKWKLNGDQLILNSDKQPTSQDYLIQKKEFNKTDSIVIMLTDLYNDTIAFAICTLKTRSSIIVEKQTTFDGKVSFKHQNSDSIIISYPGYKTAKIPIDTNLSYFHVNLIESTDFYKYFTHQILTYKNKTLIGTFKTNDNEHEKREFNKVKNAP